MYLPTIHLQRAWDKIPESHRKLLVDRGLSVQVVSPKIIELGDYSIDFQLIRIASNQRQRGQREWLWHEVGHAIDNACQGGRGWASNADSFQRALGKDLAEQRGAVHYTEWSKSFYGKIEGCEVFADLYSAVYCGGVARLRYKPSTMIKWFPHTTYQVVNIIETRMDDEY